MASPILRYIHYPLPSRKTVMKRMGTYTKIKGLKESRHFSHRHEEVGRGEESATMSVKRSHCKTDSENTKKPWPWPSS